MASPTFGAALRQIDRLFQHGSDAGLSEWQLLDRYLTRRDDSAFEAIVARHGPMVLGVCRRVLDDPHAVEDAFQATFLVLVRKARTLGPRDAIGHWLYGVAHRVALRARADAARRSTRETAAFLATSRAPGEDECDRGELARLLDEELSRLPAKYRAPIVLCYLEGFTHESAAAQLGWPVGTVKGRLARARDLLRGRLARRGVAPAAAVITAATVQRASAAVPDALVAATVRASSQAAAGILTGGVISAGAARLTEGVLSTMFATKIKAAVTAGAAVGGVMLGTWALGQAGGGKRERPTTKPASAAVAAGDADRTRPTERALSLVLDQPLPLDFNAAPLETALKHIKAATQGGALANGVPIYVDPAGLEEAGATMQSKVSIADKDASLRASLDKMLRPLKLAATTRDGVLVISSRPEIALIEVRKLAERAPAPRDAASEEPAADPFELSAAAWLKRLHPGRNEYHSNARSDEPKPEDEARNKAILEALEKPVPMPFTDEIPLEDVLKHVKEETKGPALPNGLPIYVDPVGLMEAEKTMQSPIQLDVTGVALRETLRLALKQLGLVYAVQNGMLAITNEGSQDSTTPILTLAEKAQRGELSVEQMQHLAQLFKLRAEIQRYASGEAPEPGEGPPANAAPTQPPAHQAPQQIAPEDEDEMTKAIQAALEKPVALHISEKPLVEAAKEIERLTVGPALPEGIPIYVAPGGPGATTKVSINLRRVKLAVGLQLLLSQAGMTYSVHGGLLIVAPVGLPDPLHPQGFMGGMGGGMR